MESRLHLVQDYSSHTLNNRVWVAIWDGHVFCADLRPSCCLHLFFCKSPSVVSFQVLRGLPLFLLPFGLHSLTFLSTLSLPIPTICPSYWTHNVHGTGFCTLFSAGYLGISYGLIWPLDITSTWSLIILYPHYYTTAHITQLLYKKLSYSVGVWGLFHTY